MSTTCLTIHDLLRITYTYEAQALQAQARKRSDSACFVSTTFSLSQTSANDSLDPRNLLTHFTTITNFPVTKFRHARDGLYTFLLITTTRKMKLRAGLV
jgi:hypothetical protein